MTAFTVTLEPALTLTDKAFEHLCRNNQDLQFERTATGELVIMPPTGGETGNRNFELLGAFWTWNQRQQLGYGFDSSTAFKLPNGAIRSADVAWVERQRWESLDPGQRQGFPPLCPDFMLELRSPSDSLSILQAKLQEYLDNGCQLGWLLNPQAQQVEIYRPGQGVEILNTPISLSGEKVLPGFQLSLQ